MADFNFVSKYITEGVHLAIQAMIQFGVITDEDGKTWLDETRVDLREDPESKRLTLVLTLPAKYR